MRAMFVDEWIKLEIDKEKLVASSVEIAAECLLSDFVVRLVGLGDIDDRNADFALRTIVAVTCG